MGEVRSRKNNWGAGLTVLIERSGVTLDLGEDAIFQEILEWLLLHSEPGFDPPKWSLKTTKSVLDYSSP